MELAHDLVHGALNRATHHDHLHNSQTVSDQEGRQQAADEAQESLEQGCTSADELIQLGMQQYNLDNLQDLWVGTITGQIGICGRDCKAVHMQKSAGCVKRMSGCRSASLGMLRLSEGSKTSSGGALLLRQQASNSCMLPYGCKCDAQLQGMALAPRISAIIQHELSQACQDQCPVSSTQYWHLAIAKAQLHGEHSISAFLLAHAPASPNLVLGGCRLSSWTPRCWWPGIRAL